MTKKPERSFAPVSVWVSQPEDVMAAQRIVGIVARSLGVDSVDVFMAVSQAAEQGSALLASAAGCGRLVFTPRGSAVRPRLTVSRLAAPSKTPQ